MDTVCEHCSRTLLRTLPKEIFKVRTFLVVCTLDTLVTVNVIDFFLPNRERDVYPRNSLNTRVLHFVRGVNVFSTE